MAGYQCAKNLDTKNSGCLIPCQGIFADVKKMSTEVTNDELSNLVPLEQYQIYKRFFQASSGIL